MKEENALKEKIGKRNSFEVPQGYFENLTEKVMEVLPEKQSVVVSEEEVTIWTRVKPFLYLAAMFVGAALIIQLFTDEVVITEEEDELYNEYIDISYSQAMLDDYSMCMYFEETDEVYN